MKRCQQAGFTLIEILVALAVFSILAAMSGSVIYNSAVTKERIQQQSIRLSQLQLAISMLQQDTRNLLNRAIFGDKMYRAPNMIAEQDYLEFTRDGLLNPLGASRSSLQRVAWVCKNGQLIRRTWPMVDTPNRQNYQDNPLLSHLKQCEFSYISQDKQPSARWQSRQKKQAQSSPFPIGVELTLDIMDWGVGTWIIPFPALTPVIPTQDTHQHAKK